MREKWRNAIDKFTPQLQVSLIVKPMLTRFRKTAGGFLEEREYLQVLGQCTNNEMVELLMRYLKGKEDGAFECFCRILEEDNYIIVSYLREEAGCPRNTSTISTQAEKHTFHQEQNSKCPVLAIMRLLLCLLCVLLCGMAKPPDSIHNNEPTHSSTVSKNVEEAMHNLKRNIYNGSVIANHWLLRLPQMKFVDLELVEFPEHKPTKNVLPDYPSVAYASTLADPFQYSSPYIIGDSVNFKDILHYDDIVPGRKRILIEGEPGIGKSTQTKQLCYNFANDIFANEYRIVMRVVLRVLSSKYDLTLQDLVRSCSSDVDTTLSEEDVSTLSDYISISDGEDVLFIFDGYDEFPEKQQKHSLIMSIIKGKTLPKSSFIITSRPGASSNLQDLIDKRYMVTGFGEDQIEQFIRNYFVNSYQSKADILLSKLNSDLIQIKSFCFVPLLLLMTCFIEHHEATDLKAEGLTVTGLFDIVVRLSAKHHFKDKRKEEEIYFRNLSEIQQHIPNFHILCQLAQCGTEMEPVQLIFERGNDFSEDDHFGLMNCISYRDINDEPMKSCHFLHRSFQDFLAAYALRQFSNTQPINYWKERLIFGYTDNNFALIDPNYKMMFQFFCGLGGLEDKALSDHILDSLLFFKDCSFTDQFGGGLTSMIVIGEAFAESRNKILCQRFMSHCGSAVTINVEFSHLYSAIAYLMSCYSQNITSLKIMGKSDEESQRNLSKFLPLIAAKLNKLKGIELQFEDLSDLEVSRRFFHHQKSLQNISLEYLPTLEYNSQKEVIDSQYLKLVDEIIYNHSETLEYIDLQCGNVGADRLIKSIVDCSDLKTLSLKGGRLGMVFLTDETLNLLLQKLPELVTMEISYCKYSPENIDNVVKNISNHASLQELALYKCDVSIAEVFLRGIQDRTDMRKLLIFPFFPGIVDENLLAYIVNCMENNALRSLGLFEVKGVSQCCHVFDTLENNEIEEINFQLKQDTAVHESLPFCVEHGIAKCKALKKLIISCNAHQNLSVSIVRGVIQNPSLEEVTLMECDFGGSNILTDLAKCLGQGLKTLRLYDCGYITMTDIEAIFRSLLNNTTLKELIIWVTSIELSTASKNVTRMISKVIEESLKENTVLEEFDFRVKDRDLNWRNIAKSILKGAAANQNLKELTLEIGKASHIEKPLINEIMKSNKKLRFYIYHDQ